MRLSFQIALVVLIGCGAIYAGISNFLSPSNVLITFFEIDINTYSSEARLAIETQVRLLSGMWIAAGLFIFLSVRRFETNTNLLRLVFLGLSLGAAGELITVINLDGDVQAGLIKASISIVICIVMELWRFYLVTKSSVNIE